MQDESTNNLGTINPFRYRSYYFDNETGWYYLNSRYYNPQLGRFVTMDEVEYLGVSGSLLGYNLYSYCENNPVGNSDSSGNSFVNDMLNGFFNLLKNNKNVRFNKKTKLLTVKCMFISTIIDAFLTISLFIPGLRTITSGIQSLKGIKLIGKIFGEAYAKYVFSKSKGFIIQFVKWFVGLLVNSEITKLGFTLSNNKLFAVFWMMTSIGNFFAFVFDLLDGKYDGYFNIYLRG